MFALDLRVSAMGSNSLADSTSPVSAFTGTRAACVRLLPTEVKTKGTTEMRKSLPNITFLCLIASLAFFATTSQEKQTVFAAENQQVDQLVKDSSSALQSWMAGLIDAIKTRDDTREKQLIRSLVMPIDASSWFAEHFDKNTAVQLRSAYAESMKDFEPTASRLFEADVKSGSINIHVKPLCRSEQCARSF